MNIQELVQKRSNNPNYEYNLLELITLISNKPTIFGCSNFITVASFIEGYVFSKEVLSLELKEFRDWLSVKLDFSKNQAWFTGLERKYPDSEEALLQLLILFNEFSRSKPK
jgi:hypothetical protein